MDSKIQQISKNELIRLCDNARNDIVRISTSTGDSWRHDVLKTLEFVQTRGTLQKLNRMMSKIHSR